MSSRIRSEGWRKGQVGVGNENERETKKNEVTEEVEEEKKKWFIGHC